MWIWAKNSTNLKGLTDQEFNQGIAKDSELTSDYVNTALKETAEALNKANISEPYDPNKQYAPGDIVHALCVKNNFGLVLYEMRYFLCVRSVMGVSPWGNNASYSEQNGAKIYDQPTMDLFLRNKNQNFQWATIWNN